MTKQIEPNLDDCIDRLKKLFNVITDKSLANILEMTSANLSNYRNAESRGFPYKWLITMARTHGISIDWLLFGEPFTNDQECKVITKEILLTSSYAGRRSQELGYNYKGVMTSDEAFLRLKETNKVIVISNTEYFFFSDDHHFGVEVFDRNTWIPCTTIFPLTIVARPGLKDGRVDTIEKYIKVFCSNLKQIESIDDLVNLLNTSQ